MSKAIVPGSIAAVSTVGGKGLAIARAKYLLICDRSGSMAGQDALHGKTRAEVEDDMVRDLQAKYPGQLVIEAFASQAILCLDGVLPYPNGDSTMIANALNLGATLVKGNMRAILLTDGEASDPEVGIFLAAKPFMNKLDVVYIGPDLGAGRKFLEKLADYTAGTFNKNNLKNPSALLTDTVEQLLLKSGGK
jgi:hypothetical protein